MRLELTGRHVEITPDLRKQVDRRLAKLDRLLEGGIVSAQVVLTLEKYRHLSEFTVHARGDHFLHGLGATNTWQSSIADAAEKITQQLAKMKGKWQERKRRSGSPRRMAARAQPPAVQDEPTVRRILRVRRSVVKPMTVDEAALIVESGDDTFLVFRNAATDAVGVLYRRKDGHLGLIEPEG